MKTTITRTDQKTIEKIFDSCGGENADLICTIAKRQLKILTPDHYLYIGYLIGESLAARSLWGEINKSLSLCQRQN